MLQLYSAFYAIDVFFFLSGFLAAYILLKKMYPQGGRINVLLVYFHRYFRLIPSVLGIMLVSVFLFARLGDGPMWNTTTYEVVANCDKYWWVNLLFV